MSLKLNRTKRSRVYSSSFSSKAFSKKKTLKLNNNKPIVYFLILSHGQTNFIRNPDGQVETQYIDIPNEITYFNKITYAPFGIENIMDETDEEHLIHQLQKEIPRLFSQKKAYGEVFAKILREKDISLLQSPLKILEEVEEKNNRVSLHLLNRYKDQLYQSIVNDSIHKNKIIQKTFSLGLFIEETRTSDIFVVFQKGGRFQNGERILHNNSIFKDYMVFLHQHNIPLENEKDGKFIYIPKINTQELLSLAVEYGYERVVMIDYSCDSCKNIDDFDDIIPRNEVMKIRQNIKSRMLGRGPQKRSNFYFRKHSFTRKK
jgi:hypothetical protein